MTPEDSLAAFGFTELEARLYCELLRQSPASGYRLAKAVAKAPANTYQALASLLRKGAVMVDDGTARAFRPVPPAELLTALKRRFEAQAHRAAGELARIERAPEGDRIYQLQDVRQVFERALSMIAAAGDVILFDLFPGPYDRLSGALEDAARRGVSVAGLVYEGVAEATPLTAVSAAGAPYLRERWPGAQLSLVVDAQEHLLALLSDDGDRVLHGIWSGSAYLSCLQHNGLSSEIRLLDAIPAEDDRLARISLLSAFPAGLRSLLRPLPSSAEIEVSL
jgi:sugar-specific transcriptional regulator TrmB